MRLFGYYAWHSFVNQLRKLFKTWVLVFFVVCMLLGGGIGLGTAMLMDAAEEKDPGYVEEIEEPEEEEEPAISPWEAAQLIELAAGGVVLAFFLFEALGADKNGSKIFLPADVNLLFSSPMQPQSVLMFRVMTQIGTAIFISVYMLFQLPNLILNAGMGGWAALAVVVAMGVTALSAKMLQVLLYTVFSTHPGWKSRLRTGIYAVIGLLIAGYVICQRVTGEGYLEAAYRFFNAPVTRFIPLWGWIKAFVAFAYTGDYGLSLLCFAASVLGIAGLVFIINHVKADFYEDAMAKSEETAALLEKANKESGIGMVKRKKDRGDGVWRDGLKHGSGANVFFFKTLYNRFRFGHLHFFTKTMETYLLTAVGIYAITSYTGGGNAMLLTALALSVAAFYRALGNPLEQDTQMGYFNMIPESAAKKLFWSLMGSTACCLLDVLPAIVLAAILSGTNLFAALAWLPFIVTVDLYSTITGTFIYLSVPTSAGKMVKSIVQVMFVYFGLLPDIIVIAIAWVGDAMSVGLLISAVINIALSMLFFALTPLFIEPKEGKAYVPETAFTGDLKTVRRQFSVLGLGAFLILAVGSAAQMLAGYLVATYAPAVLDNDWGYWLTMMGPLYLVGVPVGLFVMRKVPASSGTPEKLGGWYIGTFFIAFFAMYAGNLVGNFFNSFVERLLGLEVVNPVAVIADTTGSLSRIVFMVILAPVLEELIFRKTLIDRMRIYGEKTALIASAVMFGLFHGNLSQVFYAFTVGLVLGYVYLRTEKLRYSIGLHMFMNFMGSVVSIWVVSKVDLDAINGFAEGQYELLSGNVLTGLLIFGLYMLLVLGMAVTGLVLTIVGSRKVHYLPSAMELPKGKKFSPVYLNPGMLLLFAACMALVVWSLM